MQATITFKFQSALDLARTEIRAPFNGRITKLFVSPQNRLRTGDDVLTLYDSEAVEIRAQIPLKYLPILELALQKNNPIYGKAFPSKNAITIELSRLSGAVAPGSGGIDGLFIVNTKTLLQPVSIGQSLSILLDLPAVKHSLSVPPQAIYGQDRIYTVENSQLVSHHITRLGKTTSENGKTIFIIDGSNIPTDANILVTQVPNAISGMSVKTTEPSQP